MSNSSIESSKVQKLEPHNKPKCTESFLYAWNPNRYQIYIYVWHHLKECEVYFHLSEFSPTPPPPKKMFVAAARQDFELWAFDKWQQRAEKRVKLWLNCLTWNVLEWIATEFWSGCELPCNKKMGEKCISYSLSRDNNIKGLLHPQLKIIVLCSISKLSTPSWK